MATIKDHEDLQAWQLADELKRRVLQILKRTEVARHVDFCDQITRSTRSAPANLAEAFWKYLPREKAYFVRIALGSLGETQNHLRDGVDEGYYPESEFAELRTLTKRAIGASIEWHKYLMRCPDRPPNKDKNAKTREPTNPKP
jgi:four helix bundle protein